jgi:enamine deaminase RidA (YjgF/YER057c/UK114 family)
VKTVRNPDTVHAPGGRYVHQIEVANPSKVLFISGQVGERPDGSLPEDPNDQFEIAVENVLRNIAAAGLETSDLTKVTIYAVAELDPARRRATLDRLLGSHVSCSTFLYVAGLARPEYKVEVEGWAAA